MVVVVSSNATYNHPSARNFTSTFREGVEGLNVIEETTCSRQPRSALDRSTEQVHALFDLCSLEDGLATISCDVAVNALEGLVSRTLKNVEHHDLDTIGCWPTDTQLDGLEKLVLRVNDAHDVSAPTVRTVESIWMIYQYDWEHQRQRRELNVTRAAANHVGRTVRLLQRWLGWSKNPQSLLAGYPPPLLFLLKAIQTASREKVQMTESLWNFYSDLVQLNSHNETRVRQELHSHMLDILSYSGSNWDILQCSVLRNVVMDSRSSTKNAAVLILDHSDDGQLSVVQWTRALEASCARGRVPDAAWLARMILNHRPLDVNATFLGHVRQCFVEALGHCTEPGSLRYMEQLLLRDWAAEKTVTLTMARALLQKCWSSQALGARAERNFKSLFQTNPAKNLGLGPPDAPSVYYVTMTFLHEPTFSPSHVRQADRFVRKCVQTYGLHHPSNVSSTAEWRVFDELLKAYGRLLTNDRNNATTDSITTLQRADALVRFFMMRHRDGNVTTEVPDSCHLERMVELWRRHGPPGLERDQCLDYYRSRLESVRPRGRTEGSEHGDTAKRG